MNVTKNLEQRHHSAWYASTITAFLSSGEQEILGGLVKGSAESGFSAEPRQLDAWREEFRLLQQALLAQVGWLYLEFSIPRLGSRVDAVVIVGSTIMPIEFKVGETRFLRSDFDQSWDYGLDLKNFHAASHAASILPVLVCTNAESSSIDAAWSEPHADGVRRPRRTKESLHKSCSRIGLEGAQSV